MSTTASERTRAEDYLHVTHFWKSFNQLNGLDIIDVKMQHFDKVKECDTSTYIGCDRRQVYMKYILAMYILVMYILVMYILVMLSLSCR